MITKLAKFSTKFCKNPQTLEVKIFLTFSMNLLRPQKSEISLRVVFLPTLGTFDGVLR